MTIQDIGSIGELIAAIATVGTLIYLAVQIRQNTKSIRASTHHRSTASDTALNIAFAGAEAAVAELSTARPNDETAGNERR